MDAQAQRKGENEILYREVNERVRELHDDLGPGDAALIQFVCECARIDCAERIDLTTEEYQYLRDDDRRFGICHGHEDPSIEHVVAQNERFTTVEKDEGGSAEIARAHAPD
jgi:hypothetical protein